MLQQTAASAVPAHNINGHSWWPDWKGQACAIIASGPTAKAAGVGELRGRAKVLAIKESVNLAPWADVVYGCDLHWWVHRRGLPEFGGLKLAYDPKVCDRFKDVRRIEIPDKKRDAILTDRAGAIGAGGNSGFQALNLAVQFGATRIILVGFDMSDRSGVHWYGRNEWVRANNPAESNFRRWRKAIDANAPLLKSLGVEVVNASQISTVKAFPKWSITDTLKAWGA